MDLNVVWGAGPQQLRLQAKLVGEHHEREAVHLQSTPGMPAYVPFAVR